MRIVWTAFLLFTTAWCDGGFGAEAFRFTQHYAGYPQDSTSRGRVLIEGPRYRIEIDPTDEPRPYDVIVSDGGGAERALNLANRTFYELEPPSSELTSRLYLLLPVGERTVRDPQIESTQEEGPALEGYSTRKLIVELSYDVDVDLHGHKLEGKVRSTATYWYTDEVSLPLASRLRSHLRTGFPEIDGPVAQILSTAGGFALKQRVTVTREVSGEEPETAVLTRTMSALGRVEGKAQDFEVPPGFVYRKPLMAGPGK